jgi:hypothetical protein
MDESNMPINIAVICQKYSNIELIDENPPIQLLPIPITLNLFKYIFYENDTFNINPTVCNNPSLFNYISLLPGPSGYSENGIGRYKANGSPFSLVKEIHDNIASCLSIGFEQIDPTSRIVLNKEVSAIKSLCNLHCQSVVNSLRWSDILNLVLANPGYDYSKALRLTIELIFVSNTEGVSNLAVLVVYDISGLQEM